MKKIVSVLLGISIMSTMAVSLTGCGIKNIAEKVEKATGLDKAIEEANALTWVCLGEKPKDHDLVMTEVNKIIEPELGLKLNIEYIDDASFTEKTKLKMASREPVDLYFTGYINSYQTAVELKGLYDITDMLDNIKMKDGTSVKMSDVIEQYYLDSATIDGKIYGIPNQQVISNPLSINMPKHVAEECGVDLKGIEELATNNTNAETSKALMDKMSKELGKIKSKRPDLYTVDPFNPALANIYEEVAPGVSIKCDGSTDEIIITAFTPEWKYGVETIRKWYEAGYIRTDIASVAGEAKSIEERKKYAMAASTWKPGADIYYKNQYGYEPACAFLRKPYVSRTSPLLTMISVGANSQHPEEAVKLIYMMNSNKELYNLICWGIKDKHYTINEDGTAKEIPDSGYNGIAQNAWRYGNQFNGYVMEGQSNSYTEGEILFNGYVKEGVELKEEQIANVWAQTQTMNDIISDKSPAIGFVPDLTELSAEIANIHNVNDTYKARIEYGTHPVNEWYDQYIDELKTAGIEKMRDEIQKQYDEWKAGK